MQYTKRIQCIIFLDDKNIMANLDWYLVGASKLKKRLFATLEFNFQVYVGSLYHSLAAFVFPSSRFKKRFNQDINISKGYSSLPHTLH